MERTLNIWFMVVTLEVSKFSGWLNLYVPCRVARRARDAEEGEGREDVRRWRRKPRPRGGTDSRLGLVTYARSAHVTWSTWL